MVSKLINLDELQRADHDTIVKIETKLDGLITDVKIMGDGVMGKLSDHEVRIKKLEDVVIQIDPITTVKEFRILQQQFHDSITTANTYRIIAGFIGGLVMFLLTQAPNWIRIYLDTFSK